MPKLVHSLSLVSAVFAMAALAALSQATPIPTANLQVWLNADNLSGANGSPVTAWNDASGNHNNATPITANDPTLETNEAAFNGNNSVRFTSLSALENNTIGSMSDFTVFMVYQWNNLVTDSWLLSFGSFSPEVGVGSPSNENTYLTIYQGGYKPYTSLTQADNQQYQLTYTRSGTSSTLAVQNNTTPGSSTQTNTVPAPTTAGTYQVGAQFFGGTPSGHLNADVAELIIYSGTLSPTDMSTVENYLTSKYVAAVPEPATGLLAVLAALAVVVPLVRRRAACRVVTRSL